MCITYTPPEPLAQHHRLENFSSGRSALDDWLIQHALQAQQSGSARTFIVRNDERVAGYFSLTAGRIDALEATERIRKGMGRHPIPVIILARLAVHLQDQKRGIGTDMLLNAIQRVLLIAEQAGVRALLTHPIDMNATHFYLRFGFEPSPLREGQFLLLLKDAKRYLASPQ